MARSARRGGRGAQAGLPAGLALALLAGCTATRSAASTAYGALLPDEVYVEAAPWGLDAPGRWPDQDDWNLLVGFSWALEPREVRVVEDDRNAWDLRPVVAAIEAQAAGASESVPAGLQLTKDAEGGWRLGLPTEAILAILAALGAGGGLLVRRRLRKPEPKDEA